jgi:hypothetical protein
MTDDSQPETPRALAAALNLSTESLHLYRKLKGAPEGWNVEEWRGFVDRLGLARAGNATLNELKAELLREQILLARAKNRREEQEVVDRAVVEEMLGLLGQKLDLLLRLKLEVELPSRCLGKDAAELGIEGAEKSRVRRFTGGMRKGAAGGRSSGEGLSGFHARNARGPNRHNRRVTRAERRAHPTARAPRPHRRGRRIPRRHKRPSASSP